MAVARGVDRVAVPFAVEVDCFIRLGLAVVFVLVCIFIPVVPARSPAGDEPDPRERERTAADKFPRVVARRALKVAVQDGRPEDDRQREHDKLDRNDLRGIEPLQRAVDVLDLHDSRADEDRDQQIKNRKRDDAPQRIRQQTRNALCAQRGEAAKQPHEPEINQDILVPVAIARAHQQHDDADRNAQIRLKLPALDQGPDLVGTQLGVVVVGGQHDRHRAAHSDHNPRGVAPAEPLLEHERRDDAVRYQRDDAERADDGRGRESVGEEVARLADGHEHDAGPPVRALEVGFLLGLVDGRGCGVGVGGEERVLL